MIALAAWACLASASAQDLTLEGAVPVDDGVDYFAVPFEVPPGVVEIEVRRSTLGSDAARDVLDVGLLAPDGLRGWSGGNREPIVVGERAASRSYRVGPMTPGTWQVLFGEARVGSPDAGWRVEIWLRTDAPTLPVAEPTRPYAPVVLDGAPGWYAGDLHAHSEDSGDAVPTLAEMADFAEARGLDFLVVTDHNTDAQVARLGPAQDALPDLLLVPGVEFTTYAGHATGFGATAYVPHWIGWDGGLGGAPYGVADAARAFAAQGALLSINHPVLDLGDLCIGCAWALDVPDGLAAVEVQTGGYGVTGRLFYARALAFWDALCDAGRHVAAVGGSDDHRAGQGDGAFDSPIGSPTTRIWATELSVDALAQGIRDSRTVVQLQGPDGPMVELDTEPARVGDTVAAAAVTLRATVTGAAGGSLRWVHDGVEEAAEPVEGDPVELSRVVGPGGRWRVEVRDAAGDPAAVTSHVWVVDAPVTPPEGEGCGCVTGAAGAAPAGLGALVGWAIARRRRVS